jgi:hypothetical protein
MTDLTAQSDRLFFLCTGVSSEPRSLSPRRHLLQAVVATSFSLTVPLPASGCRRALPAHGLLLSFRSSASNSFLHPAPCDSCLSSTELHFHAPNLQQGDLQLSPTCAGSLAQLRSHHLAAHTPALLNLLPRVRHLGTPPTIEPRHPTHRQEATQPHSLTLSYILD